MELKYLQQEDRIRFFENSLPTTPWITVYESKEESREHLTIFSGMVPCENIPQSLNTEGWDIFVGHGQPGFTVTYNNGEENAEYRKNQSDSQIEPIVICREFHNIKENYFEIQEEFRLFHNLYEDKKRNVFCKIHDDGDEEDVIVINAQEIQIKTKFLKQYIAAKQMALVIYFDCIRYSEAEFTKKEYAKYSYKIKEDNISFLFTMGSWDASKEDRNRSISALLGKRIILPQKVEECGQWPFEERQEEYEDYIIGIDEEDKLIRFTSNPDQLANYFGTNPDAPHYVTPVFFKKDVLSKYYSNSEKYSVEDGYLRCGGLWGLRIDNDNPDYVTVFLGDLGRDLPRTSQLYWKSYNIPPGQGISTTSFKRNFLAEFTNPTLEDLSFKKEFIQLSEQWQKKFEWPLFLPLHDKDSHLFTALRIPLTNDHSEFDSQVLAITKILVDSINEKKIKKQISGDTSGLKGIGKFGLFLEERKMPNYETHVAFLKNLYALRSSGVGHRKGKKYEKIAKEFDVDKKPLKDVFVDILSKSEELLIDLQKCFL